MPRTEVAGDAASVAAVRNSKWIQLVGTRKPVMT